MLGGLHSARPEQLTLQAKPEHQLVKFSDGLQGLLPGSWPGRVNFKWSLQEFPIQIRSQAVHGDVAEENWEGHISKMICSIPEQFWSILALELNAFDT